MSAPAVRGQALPAGEASPVSTGFSLPKVGGSLQWAVTASDSLSWGYYAHSGVTNFSNLSGDLAYLSTSRYHPFSAVISGGRSWSTDSGPSYSFVGLGLSQVITAGRWNIVLSDGLSYVPGTPVPGLSGVAGLGDLGVSPVQVGPDSGQGILTNYSPEITNNAGGSISRMITGKTGINGSASYTVLRFVSGGSDAGAHGLESDGVTGSGGFTHRVDARDTFGGNYSYSSYIFLQNLSNGVPEPNFVSQVGSLTYSRQLSRKMSLSLAAGPEFTTINFSDQPMSVTAYADAQLNYAGQFEHWSLGYVRSTNSGYGVVGGALADSVNFGVGRTFGKVWGTSANVAYSRTTSLPNVLIAPYNFQTVVAGVQASRALGRNLSGYGSYTVEHQSGSGATTNAVDLFSGVNQILSFGITYSPASRQFGRP
ncbi:MAG TPA: hypothetical protein VG714_10440 [Acidobacteriaceae bacterium]|nr:hypothetical protein [Acidobacteriaceae bacterium]